ncbi:MAG: DoxX family membrane protein [Ignavibacteriae bacterium]|nr:DoxX family membrane protein [Ignavibacteriota bacterium]
MKSLLANDYVSVAVRVFIGFVFIFASIDKAADPEAFAGSINNYRLLGEDLTTLAATILPWVELLCGIAVIAGVFMRGSALLLTSLLVIFTAAIVSALIRGLDISCGCFTQDPEAGKIGWTKFAENLILIALTTFLFYSTSVKFTLQKYLSERANLDTAGHR